MSKPENPKKTGYTFKEWQVNWAEFTEWNQVKKAWDITLDAVWTPNYYTVKFNTDWASWTIADIAAQYDTKINLPNPSEDELSKTGYILTWWTSVEGWTGVEFTWWKEVSWLIDSGTITLYPVWDAKKYTITWLNSDGSLLKEDSYAYDTIPELWFVPGDPDDKRTGIFSGWNPTVVKVEGDAEYKAEYKWPYSLAKHTVNWYNSNGDLIKQDKVEYSTQAIYSGDKPTSWGNAQYNYVFTWWTLSWSDVLLDEFPAIVSNTDFVAKYDEVINSYNVVFEYTWANGFVSESGTYLYGTETGDLKVPEVTGYTDDINTFTFEKWTPELTTVEGDVKYTAIYEPALREYKVTWKAWDNEIISWYNYADPLVVPGNPSKTGYTFSNWEAQEGTPAAKNGEFVKWDYTYVAKWNANTYKIELNPNGWNGTAVNQDMTYDVTWVLEANSFTRDGYEFSWWSTVDWEVKYADKAEVINLATSWIVKLYAQRSPINYTVTYNVNSGTMPETYTGTYSVLTGINPLAEPTRTGYVFSGWFDNEELSWDKVESIAVGSTGDKTFWAKWTPATGTEYKVEHRIENLDWTGLELLSTDDLTWATDDLTNAVARDLTWFTLSGDIEQKIIAADGSTVVRDFWY